MKPKRTERIRARSTAALVDNYLSDVIDWARSVDTPTADRLAMSADDLRAKAREIDGPSSSLAVSMGAAGERHRAGARADTVSLDVLRRTSEALLTLGEDADPRNVGVGLAAAARIIKERRTAKQSASTALFASPFFTDPADGRAHDHSLAPPHYSPPRGWPCCADLPGQRPASWRADDMRETAEGVSDYGDGEEQG